jgi:arsenical pump membrane protein
VVVPLFVLAVLIGWLGRTWSGPSHLVAHANDVVTAFIGAGVSVVANNLPAASLFAGRSIAHPYALLLGLDLGPNLFVTGAMSTLLWFRIARDNGADPKATTFIAAGVPVGLLTLLAASLIV